MPAGSARRALGGLLGQVVDELGTRIVNGSYAPGQTLPIEGELCEELDISRTVLREAVKILVAKGMLAIAPRKGCWVREPRHWSFLDPHVIAWHLASMSRNEFAVSVLEFRIIVEPAAARLAAERANADQLGHLTDMLARMIATPTPDDADAFVEADIDFHDTLFAASGNPLLHAVNTALHGQVEAGRELAVKLRDNPEFGDLPRHTQLLEALRNRDGSTAEQVMRAMLTDALTELRDHIPADNAR